jgi:hypothetical protein
MVDLSERGVMGCCMARQQRMGRIGTTDWRVGTGSLERCIISLVTEIFTDSRGSPISRLG